MKLHIVFFRYVETKMPTCLAPDCPNTTGKVKKSFFLFPKPINDAVKQQVKKWLINLETGLKIETFKFGKNSLICEEDFHSKCFARDLKSELMNLPLKKKLIPGAIPTIYTVVAYFSSCAPGLIVKLLMRVIRIK